MEYLILIRNNAETAAAITGDAREEFERAHQKVQAEADGVRRWSRRGSSTMTRRGSCARATRRSHGRPVRRAGRVVGGYYRVDCADLDRATAIAARFVEARWSPIEVRRIG